MIKDAYLKNVNSVNNMEKKYTVAPIRGKTRNSSHKYMTAHFRFINEKGCL
jgi:hypothetical protein